MSKEVSQRRHFLKQASIVTIGFIGLSRCNVSLSDQKIEGVKAPHIGPLLPDPNQYMELPEGFSYRIISTAGDMMDDGLFVPGMPDGMGVFPIDDHRMIIIRNHENSPGYPERGAFGLNYEKLEEFGSENLFDAGSLEKPGLGGTSTLVYNEQTGKVEKCYLSLAGTFRNCAGGVAPWGSWLTCEEDVTIADGVIEKNHGYLFEVPASENIQVAAPVPLKAMGRFYREAVCVDPETSIVYQTEDRGDGIFYRFIPNVKEKLAEGGKLQFLMIADQPQFDTRNWQSETVKTGQEFAVKWVDIDPVDTNEDNLRYRATEMGGTIFARGEGIWFGEKELYFACTSGGAQQNGQIFKYIPSPYEGTEKEAEQPGKLILFAESTDENLLNMCDNMTIAPWGDIVLCEDNGVKNHIRGIKPDGTIYTIAANVGSTSEFAGVVFSPSGNTLFVNIQANGHTLAITGPWMNPSNE